ncbi:hypothetical protein T492DRAFT_980423, partial [Pavlovales sp. CCMP2436]|mmetsp:Transcript_34004/g.80089  ORF Transcript_34004/g.80089 Transcript_34004/m.80089 type:complete len:397 (+) Transcript_34004:35-1225(+)
MVERRESLWAWRAAALAVVYALGFMHGSSWSSCASISRPLLLQASLGQREGSAEVRRGLHAGADARSARTGEVDGWADSVGHATSRVDSNRSEKRVIAYSLYGASAKYCGGALLNAEMVHTVFPGWTARFYVDAKTVPANVLAGLRAHRAEVVEVETSRMRDQHMFWRFWAAADSTVDRFICRDVDSRLLARDFAAVSDWVDSGLPFHFERDHPSHSNYPISGGLWGGTREAAPDMLELIAAFPTDANYLSDMNFLNERVWPRARTRCLQHDAFSCDHFGARPFPMARSAEGEHVGQVYEEDGRPRHADVQLLLDATSPVACRHPHDAPTRGNGRATTRPKISKRREPQKHTAQRCRELQKLHDVIPGSSWGRASESAQSEWTNLECDSVLAASRF